MRISGTEPSSVILSQRYFIYILDYIIDILHVYIFWMVLMHRKRIYDSWGPKSKGETFV